MHSVIHKSRGGLTGEYYLRQFLFGVLVATVVLVMSELGGQSMPPSMALFVVVSTLLYPYSRFVYEGVIDYFAGERLVVVNELVMLVATAVTVVMCWAFAMFFAPFGIAYLYFRRSMLER